MLIAPPIAWSARSNEGRDGADDQAGVRLPEGLGGAAEPIEDPGPEVLPDDVGDPAEVEEHVAAVRLLEVERHALLAPVDGEEVRALAAVGAEEGRPHAAHRVAPGRLLDLDHLRAQVGEQHRAVRPGEHAREVEDADAVEEPALHRRRARTS
jgi:hypothetical protein